MRKGPFALVLVSAVVAAFLAGAWVAHRSASKGGDAGGRKILYYVDPMHPAYRSDKPGIAPDCGMQLEPVYADGTTGAGSSPGVPGTVDIPQGKRQAVGVAVGRAEKTPWTGTLRLLGKVSPDEARTYRINAASDIWVRKVFPPTTGSFVRKDEPIAAYYTSGFITAANSFLFAVDTRNRYLKSANVSKTQTQNLDLQMSQAVGNLINIGVSESQIREMEQTGKAGELVEIRSPSDGFILERAISPGQYVPVGSELYRIADLDKVWILAETYENEGRLLDPGMRVKVTQPQTKRTVYAKVTEILPQFDPQTRTMKVRLEADNPGHELRPDMFVDLEIPVRMPLVVTVPAESILDSGTRKTVYVDLGEGRFEPRAVETGRRMGDRVEISRGLMEGERVVVSGTFLVDSESRMKLAAAGIHGAWHVDPVCGMQLDEGKAKAAGMTVDHAGKTYYFCSEDCLAKFRRAPAKYLKEAVPTANREKPPRAAATHEGHEMHAAPHADRERHPAPPASVPPRMERAMRSDGAHGDHEKHAAPAASAAPGMEPPVKSGVLPIGPAAGMEAHSMPPGPPPSMPGPPKPMAGPPPSMAGPPKPMPGSPPSMPGSPTSAPARPSLPGREGNIPSGVNASQLSLSASIPDLPASTPGSVASPPAKFRIGQKKFSLPKGEKIGMSGKVVDPVCGSPVEAGRTVVYRGRTYYFCSEDCLAKFRKDPSKYLKALPPQPTPGGGPTQDAPGGEGK